MASRAISRRSAVAAAITALLTCCGGVALAVNTGTASADTHRAASGTTPASAGAASGGTTADSPASAASQSPNSGPSGAGESQHASANANADANTNANAAALPAAPAEHWQPVGTATVRTVTGHDITENECASIDGATTWTQQGYSGGDGQNVAVRDAFTFATAAAASSALRAVLSGMQSCQSTSRALQAHTKANQDTNVAETASLASAAAWQRSWTGVAGLSASGPQTNHYYVAAGGTTLLFLQFTEFPGNAEPYNTAGDPQVLAQLEGALGQ